MAQCISPLFVSIFKSQKKASAISESQRNSTVAIPSSPHIHHVFPFCAHLSKISWEISLSWISPDPLSQDQIRPIYGLFPLSGRPKALLSKRSCFPREMASFLSSRQVGTAHKRRLKNDHATGESVQEKVISVRESERDSPTRKQCRMAVEQKALFL